MVDPLKHVFLSLSLTHFTLRCMCVYVCRLNQFNRAVSSDAKYIKLFFIVVVLFTVYFFISFSVGSFVCISYALDCATMHKPFTQNWIFCLYSVHSDWRATAANDDDDDDHPFSFVHPNRDVLTANKRTVIHLHHDSYHFLILCFVLCACVCALVFRFDYYYCNAIKLLSHEIILNCMCVNIRLAFKWKHFPLNVQTDLLLLLLLLLLFLFDLLFFPWNWFRSHSKNHIIFPFNRFATL